MTVDDRPATRIERDSLGEVEVPADAYYGAQTQRAVENFAISGRRFGRRFLRAPGQIKQAAARANGTLELLPAERARAIERAAAEVAEGRWDAQFVVDVYQTGSGTSTHMNANEVIARRAGEILGGVRVHPNDEVNLGQSSNDVIPTAIHVAAADAVRELLLPGLQELAAALRAVASRYGDVVKVGRTHLQDATPVTFAQEFGGHASQVEAAVRRVRAAAVELEEVALGGTAVGTGLNADPRFAPLAIAELSALSGLPLRQAGDHFAAQGAQDAAVAVSGAVRTAAVALIKIANDLRLLGSGPRCGIGELRLPAVAPGSSIMPGKVNPVIAEAAIQAAAQAIANDVAVTLGGQGGLLELNTMLPLIAVNLIESIEIVGAAAANLARRCVRGLQVDRVRVAEQLERSLAQVTALTPVLGYDRAAEVAHRAYDSGRTIREVCLEEGLLTAEQLDRWLDPARMTRPGRIGAGGVEAGAGATDASGAAGGADAPAGGEGNGHAAEEP